MSNLGTLVTTFGANMTPLDSAITQAETKFTRFQHRSSAVFGSIKRSVFSLQGALFSLGAGLSISRFLSMTKQYETALVDMGKVTDQTFEQINKQIFSLSSALGTSTELMKGYYQTISAGVTNPVKALDLLTNASKLAKVAHIDQATTVKTLAVLMGAYGRQLKTTANAASLLLSIERYGITTTGEMATQIGFIANLAHVAGLSANEMGAALSQITKSGIGTAESVTELRALLTSLTRKFDKLPESIRKYGSVANAIKAIGFAGVLKKIMNATGGNASALTKLLGRQEAYLGLLQLTKNSGEGYAKILIGMKNKTGALNKAWKEWEGTLEGVWDTLKNKMENALVKLGYTLLPAIKNVLETLSNILPPIIDTFKQLWTIIAAFPKGLISFLSSTNTQLKDMKKNAIATGKALKTMKPPKPTFMEEFMKQNSILGENIIRVFNFILSSSGNFLGMLVSDIVKTIKFLGKEWLSLGNIIVDVLTLRPSAALAAGRKLLYQNFIATAKDVLANSQRFSDIVIKNWNTMLDKMAGLSKTKKLLPEAPKTVYSDTNGAASSTFVPVSGLTKKQIAQQLAAIKKRIANTIKLGKQLNDSLKRLSLNRFEYERYLLRKRVAEFQNAHLKIKDIAEFALRASKKIDKDEAKYKLDNLRKLFQKTKALVDKRDRLMSQARDYIAKQDLTSFQYFLRQLSILQEKYRAINASKAFIKLLSLAKIKEFYKTFKAKLTDIQKIGKAAAQGLQQSFQSFFFDAMQGKLKSLKSYFQSFAATVEQVISQMIARMMVKFLLLKVVGLSVQAVTAMGFAKGGAFVNGVQAFATGGLISSPTLFKMANGGVGIAGEAGTEAIMPLSRNARGELGVKSQQQNNPPIIVNMNISALDSASFNSYIIENRQAVAAAVQAAVADNGQLRR